MSTKKVKAILHEQLPDGMGVPYCLEWRLPATPEAYEAMVEQMAKAAYVKSGNEAGHWNLPNDNYVPFADIKSEYIASTIAALAAIGITQPKKNK
jgi:hypothetical protein